MGGHSVELEMFARAIDLVDRKTVAPIRQALGALPALAVTLLRRSPEVSLTGHDAASGRYDGIGIRYRW